MIHAFAPVPPFHMHSSFYMKRSPLVALLSGPMVVQYFAAGSMSNPILLFRKSRKKLRWKYIMFFRAKLDQFWQPASKRGDARRCPDWQILHSKICPFDVIPKSKTSSRECYGFRWIQFPSPEQRWPIWEAIVATARHTTWSLATVQSLRLQDKGWQLASSVEPECDMIACYEINRIHLSFLVHFI